MKIIMLKLPAFPLTNMSVYARAYMCVYVCVSVARCC